MSEELLEALRRALGARSCRVTPKGSAPPEPESRGKLLRRGAVHHLTVDIRGTERSLYCALPRPPTQQDTLLATAVGRSLEPGMSPQARAGRRALDKALAALDSPAERRAEAVLDGMLALARSGAGGLAVRTDETRVWTGGPGKPILRRAAIEALSGAAGTLTVGERKFLALPLTWNGVPVGGLAAEEGIDSEELHLFAHAAAAALAPAEPHSAPPPTTNPGDLRALISTIPMPAVAVDGDGNLIGASPEAESLFDFVADFDLGLPVKGRLGSAELEALVLSGDNLEGDVVVKERTFTAAWVSLASGGRVVTLYDRTHEESMERLQEDLVASVAHELRTPIAAVKGLVQLLSLRAKKLEPEKLVSLIGDAEGEIARLERLVEDLLLAARVATGGVVPVPDVIDLRPIAEDVVKHASPRYPDRHFVVEGAEEAYGDPALVRHVIWHLVDNAAKFGPHGGTVTIEIGTGAEGPEVHVTDEGEGIYSGDIPQLFRRFRQLDPSATRQHGGSGLGLFLVKAVLEAQEGRVWVRSRLGQGSTFSFRLPPAPEENER